jgi:hypothetical protein
VKKKKKVKRWAARVKVVRRVWWTARRSRTIGITNTGLNVMMIGRRAIRPLGMATSTAGIQGLPTPPPPLPGMRALLERTMPKKIMLRSFFGSFFISFVHVHAYVVLVSFSGVCGVHV